MAKNKLRIGDWRRGRFRICWLIVDEGEEGAHLGDYLYEGKPSDVFDEHSVATEAARKVAASECDEIGLFWETQSAARKALAAANAALRSHRSTKPWPEWAKQALAAGWKAPKGWQP